MSAHIVTYGVLAWLWWRALAPQRQTHWSILLTAFAFTILYAVSDEIHQLFVPGRHGQLVDVVLFDASGALVMVWLIRDVKLVRTFPAIFHWGSTTLDDRGGKKEPKKLTQKSLDQASYK